MADATVSSFFSNSGSPATGLTPTLKIYKANDVTSLIINGDSMTEIGDGFYTYVFTAVSGYNDADKFVIIADAGNSLTGADRFSVGKLSVEPIDQASITNIVNQVWDEPYSPHNVSGSFSELLQTPSTLTAPDIASIADAVWDEILTIHTVPDSAAVFITTAIDLLRTLIKYHANRTKIDPAAKTLTVYDDDDVTPIKVFTLLDTAAVPSVTEVFERQPQ